MGSLGRIKLIDLKLHKEPAQRWLTLRDRKRYRLSQFNSVALVDARLNRRELSVLLTNSLAHLNKTLYI